MFCDRFCDSQYSCAQMHVNFQISGNHLSVLLFSLTITSLIIEPFQQMSDTLNDDKWNALFAFGIIALVFEIIAILCVLLYYVANSSHVLLPCLH